MADDSDITLNGKLLSELRVVDLKRELEQRGLSKGGSKTQLTDRLRAQLRLEKLHSEAQAASSGDEAKAPNLALQDDEVTGKNDFIKQYLLQQQRNLERQREIKKKVEEERKRQSAEESADESQQSIAEEENKSKDVTSEAEVKAATNAPAGVSTSDLEMAKSRSRHYRSKEKYEAAQKREVVESTNEKGDADSTEPEVKKSKQTRSPSPRESGRHKRHRSGSSSRSRSRSPERFQSSKGHKGGHKHGRGRSSRKESRSSSRSPSPKTSSRGKAETQRVSRPRNTSRTSRSKSKSPEDIAEKTLIRRSSRRSAQAARASNSQQQNIEESGRKDQEPLEVREGTVGDKAVSFSSPDAKETSPKELPSSSSQVPLVETLPEHPHPTKREVQEIVSEEGLQKSLTETEKSVELEKETRLRQTKKTEAFSEESEVVVPKPKRGSRWSRSASDLKPVEREVAPSEAADKPDTSKRALVSADETSEQLVEERKEEKSVACEETVVHFQPFQQTDLVKEGSTREREDSDSKEQKLSKISGRDRKSFSEDELKESSEQKEKTLGDTNGDKDNKKLQEEEFIRKTGSSKQQVTSGKDFIDRQSDVGEEQAAKEDSEVPSSTKTDDTKEKVDKVTEKKKEVASDAHEDSRPAESHQKRIWRGRSKEEGAKRGEQKFPDIHRKGASSNLEEEKGDTENSEQSLHKDENQKEEDMPQEAQECSHKGDSGDVAEMSEAPSGNVENGTNPAAQSVLHEITEKLPTNQEKSEENTKGTESEQQSDTSQDAEYGGTKNMLGPVSQSVHKEPDVNETSETSVLKDKQTQPSQSEGSPLRGRSTSRSPAPREKSNCQKRKDSSSSTSSRSRSRSRSDSRKNRSSSSSSRSRSSKSESSDTEEEEPRSMKSTGSKRSPRKSVSRSPSPSTNEAKGSKKSAAAKHEGKRGSAEATKKKRDTTGENSSSRSPPRKLAKVPGTSGTDEIGKDVSNDKKEAAKMEARSFRRLGSRVSSEGQAKSEDITADKENSSQSKEKPARKRKWGSSQSKTNTSKQRLSTIEISTDSLKGLIEDVRLPAEPILELEFGEPMLLETESQEQTTDKRDVKIKRTVVMRDGEEAEEDARKVETRDDTKENVSDADSNLSAKMVKNEKPDKQSKANTDNALKKIKLEKPSPQKIKLEKSSPQKKKEVAKNEVVTEKIQTLESSKGGRHVNAPLVTPDEPEVVAREPSPPRRPVSCVVHVMNLVRPFTLSQLKQLLGRTGKIVESGFWINSIKSHCYVTYEKEEDAVKTREALHGARWPQSNPKLLRVDFATLEEIERRRAEEEGGPVPPRPQPPPPPQPPSPPVVREREKRPVAEPERKREEKPVREWDRGKRSRSSERGPATRPRSRSRERPREKEREREKEHRHPEQTKSRERKEKKAPPVEQPKVEEEPPAKLLDDLFRKTKATPCIYWLPLTEEQYQQKIQAKKERAVQRQKRMEQEEAEEEAARKKTVEQRRREVPPSPNRERAERDRQRERENELVRQRERQKERERERSRDNGRERRRPGPGNDSRERGGNQERSASRGHDRRRR